MARIEAKTWTTREHHKGQVCDSMRTREDGEEKGFLGNHKIVQKMIRGGGLACICMVGDGQGVGGNPGNNRTNPEINRTTRLGVDLRGGRAYIYIYICSPP